MNQYLNEHESVTTWFCYDEVTNMLMWNLVEGLMAPGYLVDLIQLLLTSLKIMLNMKPRPCIIIFFLYYWEFGKLQVTWLSNTYANICVVPLSQQKGMFVCVNTSQNVIHLIDILTKYGVFAGMQELQIILVTMIQRLIKSKWKSWIFFYSW